jgi:hypothetical protein
MNVLKSVKQVRFMLQVAAIVVFAPAGAAQSGPQNLNFETGDAQGLPQGWKSGPGCTLKLTHEQAKEGAYCAQLANTEHPGVGPWIPHSEF